MRVIKGTMGSTAQLLVNGKPGKLDQALKAGDEIMFTPGESGTDAQALFEDVLPPQNAKWILWNGQREIFGRQVFVNHCLVNEKDPILDGNKITYIPNDDLNNLLKQKDCDRNKKVALEIRIDGEPLVLSLNYEILVNGLEVKGNSVIHEGDSIEFRTKQITVGELKLCPKPMNFNVNGIDLEYPPQETIISFHGKPVTVDEPLTDGMDLRVEGFKLMPILSDLLPYVKFPDERISGSIKLSVNGQPAEFTTVLHPGDRLTATFN
jgi:hypothetical protein